LNLNLPIFFDNSFLEKIHIIPPDSLSLITILSIKFVTLQNLIYWDIFVSATTTDQQHAGVHRV